jgi:hypothetical protein
MDGNLDVSARQLDSNVPAPEDLDDVFSGPSLLENKAIYKLFNAAIAHDLKWPKIRLLTSDGTVVVLRRAGSQSKFCGRIVITDGAKYPYSKFYGHFDSIGYLWLTQQAPNPVRKLLRKFEKNPLSVAFEYGMLEASRMAMARFALEILSCRGTKAVDSADGSTMHLRKVSNDIHYLKFGAGCVPSSE